MIAAALLIPVRAAMRGSFPLAGTYFQVRLTICMHSLSGRKLLPDTWAELLPP